MLAAPYSRPDRPAEEPRSNFPLSYYELFLQEIIRLRIKVVTFQDLFATSDDWNYRDLYPDEYRQWTESRDPDQTYLVIQHDVDNHPLFTERMVAMEHAYNIRSNIFILCERYTRDGPDPDYQINHDYFLAAQSAGFVIGYHQNAFAMAGFDMTKATQKYREDLHSLRRIYNIDFMVPHGGAGCVVDGKPLHNVDVPMPAEFEGNLRWVFNRYGVRFHRKWSDGGLRKAREPDRIRGFDIVRQFLHTLKKGTRNFCLVHPQRWGFNVDMSQNPLLAKENWYQEICREA
jgi:hypothetical protein